MQMGACSYIERTKLWANDYGRERVKIPFLKSAFVIKGGQALFCC